jgi:hypothetical protein
MIDLTIYNERGATQKAMPGQWDELNRQQMIAIAKALFTPMSKADLEVRLVAILTDMPLADFKAILPEVIQEQLIPLVQWVLASCDLTVQLLPSVKNRWGKRFYGAATSLHNLRFFEFDCAERELYEWYQDTTNERQLFRFIACLYRPKKKGKADESDLREAFDQNLTERYAKKLQRIMSLPEAYAVLLWYKGCRQHINDLYPRIFNSGDAELVEAPAMPAYFGLMRMIAKEGIYGNFEQVEQMYLYTVLEEIDATIDEREAAEAELENLKSNAS